MKNARRWAGRSGLAAVAILALTLAACGAETTTSGLHGTGTPRASVAVGTAVPGGSPQPYPTPIPPPYTFPKTWQIAAGAPTHVSMMYGMAFAPSAPLTGYACDDAPATASSSHAAVLYVTHDGGQSWTDLPNGSLSQSAGNCAVFVDPTNANDVFLLNSDVSAIPASAIWRSRDGGVTWHPIIAPTVQGWPSITVQKATVLGARLVVSVSINGEGQLSNDLYASDDNGASWHQFAASLPANVTDFVTLGGSMVVETNPAVAGSAAAPSTIVRVAGSRALVATLPRSSGGPAPVFYRSDDGGSTWVKVTIPGGLPVFTQAASGGAYYGVSIAAPTTQGAPVTAYWTQDSGATWTALPTLQGVAGGWVDPTSLGIGLAVGPDGSVYTDTLHPTGTYNGECDAGILMLRPTDSAPSWQPLAWGASYSMVALPESGGGLRLVNLRVTNQADYTATPAYLDLP